LDEGRLTDNKGRLADFKKHYHHDFEYGKPDYSEKFESRIRIKGSARNRSCKVEVLGLLKQTVPEFINRIDEIVMFTPLTNENITKIVGLQLKSVTKC
jgi:ATP-dependent Clp protease ATP-binding subunit ClpB